MRFAIIGSIPKALGQDEMQIMAAKLQAEQVFNIVLQGVQNQPA